LRASPDLFRRSIWTRASFHNVRLGRTASVEGAERFGLGPYREANNTGCPAYVPTRAFPGLFPEDKGALIDATAPDPHSVVKDDTSEYLIRFQSVKPVQTAIQQLLAIGEKWSAYGPEHPVSASDGPTDVANAIYNIADMITVAVILKHPGPEGTNLFDYGYEQNGRAFPSRHFRVFPCAGLRTSNGQVFAHLNASSFGHSGYKAMQLSFPQLIDGKPLISNPHEKVEFRLVANQRVFETTFYVDVSDVLDGSESSLYLPAAFTDLNEATQQVAN
jgi:hypothetical protein